MSWREVQFALIGWLRVERLTAHSRFTGQSCELHDEVLELSDRIAAERFPPHNAEADAAEPYLGKEGTVVLVPGVPKALRTFAEAGLPATSLDDRVGGMPLPTVVGNASFAFFQAANAGTSGHTWVRPMVEGRFLGTTCLSEPQAGSSLADTTTRAEVQGRPPTPAHGTRSEPA